METLGVVTLNRKGMWATAVSTVEDKRNSRLWLIGASCFLDAASLMASASLGCISKPSKMLRGLPKIINKVSINPALVHGRRSIGSGSPPT